MSLSGVQRLLQSRSQVLVLMERCDAPYFSFCRPLQAGHVFYDEWAAASENDDLATGDFRQVRK